jgi:hypothetical protein
MKKKTEPASRLNWKNLAKKLLLFLFPLLFHFQARALQEMASDSIGTKEDSLGFDYHRPAEFGTDYVDSYLAQKEFQYKEIQQEQTWLDKIKQRIQNAWDRFWAGIFGSRAFSGFWKVFFQLAPYLLLLVLMALLVWLAMKYGGGESQDKRFALSAISSDEVLLKSDNLKALAEEAMRSGDYRLALRYRYLIVLQHLIQQKLIVWKSSKTNYEYQRELQGTGFQAPFSEVTRIYNFVWYGHFDLDEKTYGDLEKAFTQIDQLR